ncbi:MAG: alpha/beta fold hydrolase [Solirubrobacterales bacterium]
MPALQARGVELSYGEKGEGAPVVLLHETGTGSGVWDPLIGALGPDRRAVAYDRRGWGASTVPDGYRRTTIEEQSEDASVLIESLEAAPAAVCGAGLGAVIALDLLLRRPELVRGAVLVEPPVLALVPEATGALSEDRLALEEAYRDRGLDGVVGLYLSGGLAALAGDVDRLPTALTAEARERPRIVLAELGAAAGWSMPLVRLASAERPSVIVTSPSTPPLLREAAAALALRLAGSETEEVAAGHGPPHVGAPAEVADALGELAG